MARNAGPDVSPRLAPRPRQGGFWGDTPQREQPRRSRRSARALAGSPAVVGRSLTAAQVTAVREVMRLFVEEDLAWGVSPSRLIDCAACALTKPAPGFVHYERWQVCHECAVNYETARLRGRHHTIAEYLAERVSDASA